MSHLEDLAAALVDGELSSDERDRALDHLAGCSDCRADVELQRLVKTTLAAQIAPEPSAALLARLHGVPQLTEPTTDVRRTPTARRFRISRRPAAGRPVARPATARRAMPRVLTGSLSFVSAAVGLALLIGGGEAGTGVTPPVGSFVVEHAATSDQLPLNDPAAAVVLTSFSR